MCLFHQRFLFAYYDIFHIAGFRSIKGKNLIQTFFSSPIMLAAYVLLNFQKIEKVRKESAYKRGIVAVRPKNINQQDWKYTSFSIFIRHSQNMRRPDAKDEYKPHDGRRRKHWIETPISKLIINPLSFTYIIQMDDQFDQIYVQSYL